MKELSRVSSAIKPSATLAVNAKFQEMKAAGIPVVGFGAGEPDFETPDNIKEAGIRAIREGKTRYIPTAGTMEVRKAIAGRLQKDFGLTYDPTDIIVSNGAKMCLYATLTALVNPGDEVILPVPYWVSYWEMISMNQGIPVTLPTSEATRFKITPDQLEAAINEKTKALILNNPSNPSGMIYSREELAALAEVCVRHDLYIIADEIYYSLRYDGRSFTSVASLGDEIKKHCIVINGASKAYAMTGWRVGYAACGDKAVSKVMSNCMSHMLGSIGTMNQCAMVEAMNGPQDSVETMRQAFEARRNYLVERMNTIPGVHCLKPDGAFYVMMNIDELLGKTLGGRVIRNADDFAMAFLEKGLVAVVSCTAFGCPNYVRWTYACSMDNIKEGLDRLEKFLREG